MLEPGGLLALYIGFDRLLTVAPPGLAGMPVALADVCGPRFSVVVGTQAARRRQRYELQLSPASGPLDRVVALLAGIAAGGALQVPPQPAAHAAPSPAEEAMAAACRAVWEGPRLLHAVWQRYLPLCRGGGTDEWAAFSHVFLDICGVTVTKQAASAADSENWQFLLRSPEHRDPGASAFLEALGSRTGTAAPGAKRTVSARPGASREGLALIPILHAAYEDSKLDTSCAPGSADLCVLLTT